MEVRFLRLIAPFIFLFELSPLRAEGGQPLEVGDPQFTEPTVVLVLGDTHTNSIALYMALHQAMKQETKFPDGRIVNGVTHVILDGDMTHSNSRILEKHLRMVQEVTKLPKEKIYAILGNREVRNGTPPEESVSLLHQLTTPIPSVGNEALPVGTKPPRRGRIARRMIERVDGAPSDIGRGVVNIGGHRFLVSHFLQHPPPKEMMNEIFFHPLWRPFRMWNLRRMHSIKAWVLWEPTTRNMMAAMNHPYGDYDLEIVGHWHKQFYFTDPTTGVLVVNPGSLANDLGNNPFDNNRFDGQPYGYATYSFIPSIPGGTLRFYDAQLKDPLIDQLKVPAQSANQCKVLVSHLGKGKK